MLTIMFCLFQFCEDVSLRVERRLRRRHFDSLDDCSGPEFVPLQIVTDCLATLIVKGHSRAARGSRASCGDGYLGSRNK
jgi:hypothetical protein